MSSKGSLAAWLLFIIISISIIIGYSVFSRIYAPLFPFIETQINETAINSTKTEAVNLINLTTNVWQYWILVFFLLAIIWVIATSQKEEPIYYGG